ncbi:MAG: translocation/assembly module TamB domain-containing protein, partial [Bacteroidia bacterium]
LDGNVSGNLALHNTLKKLAFSSNLVFTALKLNNNDLGNGELNTEYNSADKYVYLDGYTSIGMLNLLGEKVKNISFSGYYYPDKKENSLDITFGAQPANLKLLNPIVKGLMTFNTALVSGEGTITGSMDKPLINGKFKIIKCDLKVDFTNVTYSLLGNVEIMPDQIRFDDITVSDNVTKNKIPGTINGNIFHENFKNMRIDFDINYNNMLVLNTVPTEGASFYGKAFASGSMGIYGLLNNVKLEINTKTEKGTVFNIPLDGPAEVADNNFIRFITKDTIKKKIEEKQSGFSLDMNLTATPDAEVQIIFDAKNGDVIKARGAGDLNLKINNLGKFEMFGEYELASGDYLFTLENFITKKFEIDKGSLIKWSGSPLRAEINIAAVYKQRASIAPLFPLDTTGIYKRRYPVDCKLYMKDKLMSPDISFGIELPTIDDNTRSKIKAIMLDESELNRQVFSLLLLKSFVTPLQYSSAGGISTGKELLAANSSEMLSNRLSSWLNGLTKQVDIGVNYRPGGTTSSDELDIALSKQLLNNRLSVDGNLGVNNNQNKSTNGNGLIGDVNVEYKLTDDGRYRVKGFNRSNDNTQITTTGGPFTQGVGVFYREEFETWPDLYRRYLNKLKGNKPKDKQPPNDADHKIIEATDPEKSGN